jgi:hypothetical protein
VGALVADSAFTDLSSAMRSGLTRYTRLPGLLAIPAIEISRAFGVLPTLSPVDVVRSMPGRAFLFLHARGDRLLAVANADQLFSASSNHATRLVDGGFGRSSHPRPVPEALVQLVERARMRCSRRRRASSIGGCNPRYPATCLLSSRTARTMSDTRSAGTLPSSSEDRVAVMAMDNCLLSFVMGRIVARLDVGSPSDGSNPLAKVVAGVVEGIRVGTPRRDHPCRRDPPG